MNRPLFFLEVGEGPCRDGFPLCPTKGGRALSRYGRPGVSPGGDVGQGCPTHRPLNPFVMVSRSRWRVALAACPPVSLSRFEDARADQLPVAPNQKVVTRAKNPRNLPRETRDLPLERLSGEIPRGNQTPARNDIQTVDPQRKAVSSPSVIPSAARNLAIKTSCWRDLSVG